MSRPDRPISDSSGSGPTVRSTAAQLQRDQVVGGRYRIETFLDRGAMGEVYWAKDLVLEESVALKVLPANELTDDALKLFLKELQLARRISHPNVCRLHLYEKYDVDGRPLHVLAMELLEGETLAARLKRGPLSQGEARALLDGLCKGLQAIHDAGVVHRDLKPANVFLCPEAKGETRVVIADFGVARALADGLSASRHSGMVGTPAYMAPEQYLGGALSNATDIYALGLVVFEALTGTLPFGDDVSLYQRARVTPKAPSSLVQGLAPQWDEVVARCLQPEPKARFQRADAVASAMTLRPSAIRHRPARRSKALGVTAAAVLALGAGAWWYSGSLPSQPVLATSLRHDFTGGEAWVGRASESMLRRVMQGDARFALAGETANTEVRFEVTHGPGAVSVSVDGRRATFGRWHRLASASGPSVRDALAASLGGLAAVTGTPAARDGDASETAAATRVGAPDVDALRRLDRFIDCYWTTTMVELDECRAQADALAQLAPAWPLASLAVVLSRGVV